MSSLRFREPRIQSAGRSHGIETCVSINLDNYDSDNGQIRGEIKFVTTRKSLEGPERERRAISWSTSNISRPRPIDPVPIDIVKKKRKLVPSKKRSRIEAWLPMVLIISRLSRLWLGEAAPLTVGGGGESFGKPRLPCLRRATLDDAILQSEMNNGSPWPVQIVYDDVEITVHSKRPSIIILLSFSLSL